MLRLVFGVLRMFDFEEFIEFDERRTVLRIHVPTLDDEEPDFGVAPIRWTAQSVAAVQVAHYFFV